MDEQDLVYEQEEVVWAKIRGYPWWPAYVSQLHPLDQQELEYTVIFFGDNTNARLDASKLRKFADCYLEFYNKAKNHKKLMMSIMMAEQNLKENDQNVDMFREFRDKSKPKNKKGKKGDQNSQNSQIICESPPKNKKNNEEEIFEEQESSAPKDKKQDKRKSKPSRGRPCKVVKEEEGAQNQTQQKTKAKEPEKQLRIINPFNSLIPDRKIQMEVEESNDELGRTGNKKQSEIFREVNIVINFQNQQIPAQREMQNTGMDIEMPVKSVVEAQKQKQQTMKDEKPKRNRDKNAEQSVPKLIKQKTEPVHSQIVKDRKQHPTIEEQDEVEKEAPKSKDVKRSASSNNEPPQNARPIVPVRKRGRPKKTEVIVQEQDESYDEDQNNANKAELQKKKKLIKKTLHPQPRNQNRNENKIQKPQEKKMTIAEQEVLNGVQKTLNNRQELIAFLLHSNSTITVDNVKEILEMDVSNILQEGQITEQVIHLLELFRAALLFKYFPEDFKHKKKFERLSKKKMIEQLQEKPEEKPEENAEKQKIRTKTIQKLNKFLKGIDESEQEIAQISKRIEQNIFKADNTLNQRYCRIAFLVLSALKQKKQTYQDIMKKLESKVYE